MGASESIPRELTHQRLYELTHDTRAMMNMILQYMLKEVTVKDFLALSNPNECKKYVLFMANTLHKYFYELQIHPTRDRGGVIAFRSVRDLVAPSAETDREKQSLCLVLAYYYTRIFQIYGALALTLIDDIASARDSGIMTEGQRRGLVAPGQRPVIYGGAITEAELGRFAFLKGFLLDEKTARGYRTKFHEQNGLYGEVFFAIKREDPSQVSDLLAVPTTATSQKGTFIFGYEGARRFSTIDISVERVSLAAATATASLYGNTTRQASALRITFENFQYAKRGETTLTAGTIPTTYFTKTLPLLYPITMSDGQTGYAFRETSRSVNEVLQESLYRIMRFTKALVEEGRVLERLAEVTGATGATARTNASKIPHSDALKELSTSEENTVEELRLGKILHNLTQTKPYGHCIARALQLLDSVPYRDHPAISHICKAKFLEVSGQTEKGTTTRYTRSGIPEPGSALTTSPGLLALSMLFYDTITVGTPKLAINQQPGPTGKSSLQQYTEFMRRMATYYGDNRVSPGSAEVRSDDSLREGLSGIKNRRDPAVCKGHTGDITIGYDTAMRVQRLVQSMFQEQLEHASVCGKLFKMLFDIQREPKSGRVRIALHENILRKGVPEINRINFLAREQLMKYYSNCEVKYLSGIKLVIDSKRQEKATEQQEQRRVAIPEAIRGVERFMATAPTLVRASKESIQAARDRGEIPPFIPRSPAPVVAPAPVSVPVPAPVPSVPVKKVVGPPSVPSVPAAPKPSALPSAPVKKVFGPSVPVPSVPLPSAPVKKVFEPPVSFDGVKRFMAKPVAASKESVEAARAAKKI